MKALVFHGPGQRSWDDVPDAAIAEPTDAVIRVDSVTICGTDLHILKGDVPTVEEGRTLGHEPSEPWWRPATPWRTSGPTPPRPTPSRWS